MSGLPPHIGENWWHDRWIPEFYELLRRWSGPVEQLKGAGRHTQHGFWGAPRSSQGRLSGACIPIRRAPTRAGFASWQLPSRWHQFPYFQSHHFTFYL